MADTTKTAAPTSEKPAGSTDANAGKDTKPVEGEEDLTPAAKAEHEANHKSDEPAESKEDGAKQDPPESKEKDPPKDPPKDPDKPTEKKGSERVIPETYELKLPEGSSLSEGDVERIAKNAKEQKLTLDEAQADLDIENDTIQRHVEDQQAVHTEKMKAWALESQKDPEVGGGSDEKSRENAATIQRVLKRFAPEGFQKALESTGLGNQVFVNQFLLRIGKGMSEDKIPLGGFEPKSKKTLAEKLYPNQGK